MIFLLEGKLNLYLLFQGRIDIPEVWPLRWLNPRPDVVEGQGVTELASSGGNYILKGALIFDAHVNHWFTVVFDFGKETW